MELRQMKEQGQVRSFYPVERQQEKAVAQEAGDLVLALSCASPRRPPSLSWLWSLLVK